MKKILYVLPFVLCGCDTMNEWADGVGDYVPEMPSMPTMSSAPAAPQKQQPMQKTNTNMYSVPQQ